ncbi:PREDICTED: uncharacterized protein LOC108618541 [Drosophila arizonae]|uniref:Uncharacterized protein LOC108618541 n=1 Tax=Drosophila arizonae TaxID=7263 RepID=A0ABM1PSA4_DROAR|nr:PREDICTED: uncharacterized protein LOC108618541 [Drosophila arizonae]
MPPLAMVHAGWTGPPQLAENGGFNSFLDDPSNLRKLFLPRRTLQLLSELPDFQWLVRGCFVRVRLEHGHRVAQIQSVVKWQPSSELTLVLRTDSNPRVYPLSQLANTYYERCELLEWRYIWQSCHFELPTKCIVEQKHQALVNANLRVQQKLCDVELTLKQEYFIESELPALAASSNATATPPRTTQQIKYLVEPMECYRRYLPTTPPVTAAAVATAKASKPHELTTPNCPKKKISLDEYRERCIKKKK